MFCLIGISIWKYLTSDCPLLVRVMMAMEFSILDLEPKDTSHQKWSKESTLGFRLICSPLGSYFSSFTLALLHFWAQRILIKSISWSGMATSLNSGHCMKRRSLPDSTLIPSRDCWTHSSLPMFSKDPHSRPWNRTNGCVRTKPCKTRSVRSSRPNTPEWSKLTQTRRKLNKPKFLS